MPPLIRPENLLKRADELIAVGQPTAALEILHDVISSKRTRNVPTQALEAIILRFVDLAVDLRKGKIAKDGLYQYKNATQNTSVASIELVLKHFIDLSEAKVTEAQAKAEKLTLDNIDDLEAIETPEDILLSTVSAEQSKDRTDRAVVTPWLKFLWETYRTVLDILRNNARLEIMYQSVSEQAFQFCLKYSRKTEFRRLCELLRNHLQNASKNAGHPTSINLSDPDTLQRHLDTRFTQLNAAVELELWQEAFRSVEDIHTLLTMSRRPAKPQMMANYYEKLVRIFLVSGNLLFHAAAWNRLYQLLRQSKSTPESQLNRAATFVLLSALSIPNSGSSAASVSSRNPKSLVSVDENKHKNARLTVLLGLSTPPTRAGLLKDALSKGLLARSHPGVQQLYQILEVKFHPLSICASVAPVISQLSDDPDLSKYFKSLHQVILIRLFQQLAQVYDSVKLDFVLKLAQFPAPFETSVITIERFVMTSCRRHDLLVKMDHAEGLIKFENDLYGGLDGLSASSGNENVLQSSPAEIVYSQLSRVANTLSSTLLRVDEEFVAKRVASKEAALRHAILGIEEESNLVNERLDIINKRETYRKTEKKRAEEEEQKARQARIQQEQAAEQKRLAEDARKREVERIQKEQEAIRLSENKRLVEEILSKGSVKVDIKENVAELDANKLRAMQLEQLEKEKNERQEIMRIVNKRIDHLERAYRKEEIELLAQDYENQKKLDRELHDERKRARREAAKRQHVEQVALKHRLKRILPQYLAFKEEIGSKRQEQFEALRQEAQEELEKAKQERIESFKREKARELEQEREREQRLAEEEERQREEEEEKERQKKEREEELAQFAREKEEQRRELDAKAAIQRQKEEEVAERRRQEAAKQTAAPPPTAEKWRRRGPAAAAPSSPSSTEPPTSGKYVPPSSGGPRRSAASPSPRTPSTSTPPPQQSEPQTRQGAYQPGMFRKMRQGQNRQEDK